MRSENLSLDQLLLDPNNYRLQDQADFVVCAPDRFHIDRVQAGTLQRMREESIRPLRDSIVSNGFLEIERIVVAPYEHADGKYLVIEGNRRVAALRQIRDEYNAGVDIPQTVVDRFEAVPCLVADDEGQDAYFREAIMGIRHVGGIKEWGGYQSAKLIADLHDQHDLDSTMISQRLGLSVLEVNRRYRAYKALQQMQDDEAFSDYAGAKLYPIFHEAVSLPIVRDWLGWDQNTFSFEDDANRESFYQLITPCQNDAEDGDDAPKISTYSEVRQLRDILPNNEAKASLLQLHQPFVDALTIANRNEISRRWRNEVGEATTALQNIPGLEVEAFDADDIQIIRALVDTAERVLRLNERVAGADHPE